jgi:hypothetical protein
MAASAIPAQGHTPAMRSHATKRPSAKSTLIEILVRVAHVRVFGFVANFGRELCVPAMDVRNIGGQ